MMNEGRMEEDFGPLVTANNNMEQIKVTDFREARRGL
jgi:hypothetical protein